MTEEKPSTTRGIVIRGVPPLLQGFGRSRSEFEGLWFTLSRIAWRSLVIVPVDLDDSAAGVAIALTAVGRRLRPGLVTFLVMAGPIDYPSAGKFMSAVTSKTEEPTESPEPPRVIVSTPSVLVEPLALAVVGAADAVALCMAKGKTELSAAERTIQLIGRDRVVGCILR